MRPDDAEEVALLLDACFEIDGGYRTSEAEVREEFEAASDDDPIDTVAAVENSGTIQAMAWCSIPASSGVKWRVLPWVEVHPASRSTGLEDRLFDWVEARASMRLSRYADDLPRVFRNTVYDWRHDRIALLERRGYVRSRYFEEMARPLTMPLPEVEFPAGVRVEVWSPAVAEVARGVHNDAFADHWGSVPWSAERWAGFQGESLLTDASFVAYEGADAVGYLMAAHYPHDFEDRGRTEAWIEGLGTVTSHRGQGIGSSLIAVTMRRFAERGYEYACIGVDSENPSGAHRMYARLGFEVERREIVFVKEFTS